MFKKMMVQVPTCLANVGAGAFSTLDAVNHTFPAIGWYWVLGVHKLLAHGPEGRKVTWMARGAKTRLPSVRPGGTIYPPYTTTVMEEIRR